MSSEGLPIAKKNDFFGAEEGPRPAEEKESDYANYKTLGGILNQEDYQNVLMSIVENAPLNPAWSRHAHLMAKTAGITLSPETVTIYGILRGEKPDPRKEHFSEMSDHKLLAEALRIVGNTDSLITFVAKYPHIFN